jgi:hypothetical protein
VQHATSLEMLAARLVRLRHLNNMSKFESKFESNVREVSRISKPSTRQQHLHCHSMSKRTLCLRRRNCKVGRRASRLWEASPHALRQALARAYGTHSPWSVHCRRFGGLVVGCCWPWPRERVDQLSERTVLDTESTYCTSSQLQSNSL